jgi:hypothetical protein
MKTRIAFLLGALSLALSACAAEPVEGEAIEPEEQAAASLTAGDEAGGPSTSTEYTYWRCSTNGGLYLTRTACQTACPTGTCRLTLICKNSQGQQIPCP